MDSWEGSCERLRTPPIVQIHPGAIGGSLNSAIVDIVDYFEDGKLFSAGEGSAIIAVRGPHDAEILKKGAGILKEWIDMCDGWDSPNLLWSAISTRNSHLGEIAEGLMPKAFDDPTYGLGKVAFIGFLALLSARSTMKLRCQRSLYTIDFLDGMPISAGKWNEEPGELAFQFAVTLDRRFFPADSFDEKAIERMITIRSEYRIREALARSQAGRRMSDGGC